MEFKSNIPKVIDALKKTEKDILDDIGKFVKAEAQMRAPILTGNLRRSIDYQVVSENEVDIGATAEADYAVYVEKGTSKMAAQPFLEPAAMDNLGQLEEIAGQRINANMGGK